MIDFIPAYRQEYDLQSVLRTMAAPFGHCCENERSWFWCDREKCVEHWCTGKCIDNNVFGSWNVEEDWIEFFKEETPPEYTLCCERTELVSEVLVVSVNIQFDTK